MAEYSSEQEQFWAGAFGNEYSQRNVGADWVASNAALFTKILARTGRVQSVLELGANIGLNLRALRALLPSAKLGAVEINASAVAQLREIGGIDVTQGSLLEYEAKEPFDLVLIKGVLIHIAPDLLPKAYEVLFRSSARYVVVAEYYNPTPVEVPYRGHANRLFKRDFAGELMERYPSLRLVDYGFAYRRDPVFPQDDITWFLLEKK